MPGAGVQCGQLLEDELSELQAHGTFNSGTVIPVFRGVEMPEQTFWPTQ